MDSANEPKGEKHVDDTGIKTLAEFYYFLYKLDQKQKRKKEETKL